MSSTAQTPSFSTRLVSLLPTRLRPYAVLIRLDAPSGWQLLLLPCLWSNLLAGGPKAWPDFLNARGADALIFLLGAFATRSFGVVWNDMTDADLDKQVARTANRPLASGAISRKAAFCTLAAMGVISFSILLFFNLFTIFLAVASLPLIFLYPFAKRLTSFPQCVLGLVFSWGALVGWSSVHETLDPPALLLYVATFFWIVGFDTLYALQDVVDDAKTGIRSTALAFGKNVPLFIAACYFLAALFITAAISQTTPGFFAFCGSVLFAGHLLYQICSLSHFGKESAARLFRANRTAGFLLLTGLWLQNFLDRI